MVIGNPTRTEESAIHSERNRKGRGAWGTLATGGEEKMPECFTVPSLGLLLGSESAVRKKMAPFSGSFNSSELQNYVPLKEFRNS